MGVLQWGKALFLKLINGRRSRRFSQMHGALSSHEIYEVGEDERISER